MVSYSFLSRIELVRTGSVPSKPEVDHKLTIDTAWTCENYLSDNLTQVWPLLGLFWRWYNLTRTCMFFHEISSVSSELKNRRMTHPQTWKGCCLVVSELYLQWVFTSPHFDFSLWIFTWRRSKCKFIEFLWSSSDYHWGRVHRGRFQTMRVTVIDLKIELVDKLDLTRTGLDLKIQISGWDFENVDSSVGSILIILWFGKSWIGQILGNPKLSA